MRNEVKCSKPRRFTGKEVLGKNAGGVKKKGGGKGGED